MELFDTINEVLAKNNIHAAGPLIINPAIEQGVYIPLSVRRDSEGRQIPSKHTLQQVRNELEDLNIVAEYHIVDETARVVDEGLRETLAERFPDIIDKVVVSTTNNGIQVWIDTLQEVDSAQAEIMKEHVRKYVKFFNIRLQSVDIASETNLPSNLELVSLIRRLSPVDCHRLEKELVAGGFEVPSLTWINHKLDTLRKAGHVVRLENRSYAVTPQALHRLGTSKGRYSPDIARLLFLARGGR